MPADARKLDVPAMQDAAARLVGEHNFQNLCKMNVANTTQHVRRIVHARLEPMPLSYRGAEDVLVLHIRGTSFLWHQASSLHARICTSAGSLVLWQKILPLLI